MDKPQTYTLQFNELTQLKKYYMPFIENGGIFITTTTEHVLSEKIILYIYFPNEPEKIEIIGSVVWINPAYAQYGREQGVGIQIENDNNSLLKNKIEKLLNDITEASINTATI